MQADSDPLIQVLPTTGVSVSVSFYNTAAQKLAAEHAIIRALLQVCPQQRKGCYTAATVDLMNAAAMPSAMVRLVIIIIIIILLLLLLLILILIITIISTFT